VPVHSNAFIQANALKANARARAFAKFDRSVDKGLPFCPDAQSLFKRFKGPNVYTAVLGPLNDLGNFEKGLFCETGVSIKFNLCRIYVLL
jgi:hypothetical protein